MTTSSKRKAVLNPEGPVPLYYQLREAIRTRIETGEFPRDQPLPSEAEFREMYGVSRATVREALRSLADRGLIEKRQGIGTFISDKKIDEKLPSLNSFSTEMRLRGYGYDVRSDVLSKAYVDPPLRIARLLQVDEDSQVLRVSRLRYVDDKPFLISTSFFPPFVSIDDDFSGSIYQLLENKYGLLVSLGEASIEAGQADEDEARLLSINPSDSVLRITWIGQTADERPVEYSEGTYRGDRYRYIVQLRR